LARFNFPDETREIVLGFHDRDGLHNA